MINPGKSAGIRAFRGFCIFAEAHLAQWKMESCRKSVDFTLRNGYTIGRKWQKGGSECMPQILSEILKRYVEDVHRIYGEKLKTVILYGSYARGDFRPDSDIDIMILVDLPDDEIRSRGHALSDLTFNYNFDNNLKIMPIVKNLEHFNKWLRAYPFYNNVKNEGVELYAA